MQKKYQYIFGLDIPSHWEGLQGVIQEEDNHQGSTKYNRWHLFFCKKIDQSWEGFIPMLT